MEQPKEGQPDAGRRNILKVIAGAGVVAGIGSQVLHLLGMGRLEFRQAHDLTVWAGEEQSRLIVAWNDIKSKKPKRSKEEVEARQKAYEDVLQKIVDSDYPWMLLNMVRTKQLSDTGKTKGYVDLAAQRFSESLNQRRTSVEQRYFEQGIIGNLHQVHGIPVNEARQVLSQLATLAKQRVPNVPRPSPSTGNEGGFIP